MAQTYDELTGDLDRDVTRVAGQLEGLRALAKQVDISRAERLLGDARSLVEDAAEVIGNEIVKRKVLSGQA